MRFLLSLFLIGSPVFANQMLVGAPVSATATTVSAQVLAANSLRSYLLIVNTGANPVVVKFGSTQSSATDGIPIPAGGNYEPFIAMSNSVFAITASSTTTLKIIQGQ